MRCKSLFFHLVPAVLCLSALVCCGGGSSDGVYIGTVENRPVNNNTVAVAIIGKNVFLDSVYNYNSKDVQTGVLDAGSSVIKTENEVFPYTLKKNTITLDNFWGETVVLTKDTKTKALAAINGMWTNDNWSFAFLGSEITINIDGQDEPRYKMYIIDDKGDVSSGTYTFDKNEGEIKGHWYDADFSINGNTLTAELWGSNLVLTKVK